MNQAIHHLIAIVGPTGVGKTDLAIKLALRFNGEIVNGDSRQIYRGMDIGTAKPTLAQLEQVRHHLFNLVNPDEDYNLSLFLNAARSTIRSIHERSLLPIVVGGTGLYINSLLNGLANIPKVSETYKKKSNNLLLDLGLDKFYNEVYKIDNISCKKISKNDTQRLKRIWEVYYSTGKTISEWINDKHSMYLKNYDYNIFLFTPNREEIYKKVDRRFLKMIDKGVIEEVKKLLSLKLNTSLPIMKAHGVPEISDYLSGSINLEECIAKTQQVTRNYVKRQLTWWKSSKLNIHTIFEDFPLNIDIKLLNY